MLRARAASQVEIFFKPKKKGGGRRRGKAERAGGGGEECSGGEGGGVGSAAAAAAAAGVMQRSALIQLSGARTAGAAPAETRLNEISFTSLSVTHCHSMYPTSVSLNSSGINPKSSI